MKSPPFRYKVIEFKQGMQMRPPDRSAPREFLVDVDGVPHAGGIDVRFDEVVRTIPWHRIAHADRALPSEDKS